MARKNIEDMAAELYEDEVLRAAVLQDAREKGTVRRIEKGELVLPHPVNAQHWLQKRVIDRQNEDKEEM